MVETIYQEFAGRLRASIRTSDIAARVGGDEFALLLTCDPDPHNYAAAIQRIRAALEAPTCLENTCYQIHASMGIAVYPQDGDELLVLLKRADNEQIEAGDVDGFMQKMKGIISGIPYDNSRRAALVSSSRKKTAYEIAW